MTVTTKSMTVDELERMPKDASRYDLIRGVLKRMSPTGFLHHKVAGNVTALLHHFVTPRGLGVGVVEGGFVLEIEPDTVLAPDVAFVRTDRLPRRTSGTASHGSPRTWRPRSSPYPRRHPRSRKRSDSTWRRGCRSSSLSTRGGGRCASARRAAATAC